MSNNNTTVKQKYLCDGSDTTFAIPFFFLEGEESVIKVYLIDNATEVATLLTLTADYTLNSPATEVTTLTAYPSTKSILVKRVSPKTQLSEFAQGPFPFEAVEEQFDRVVSLVQEVSDAQNNLIGLPEGSALANITLPVPEADKLIGWNGTADGLENKDALDVTALQAEIDAVEVRMTAAESDIDTLEINDAAQDFNIADALADIATLQAQILVLQENAIPNTGFAGSKSIINNQVVPEPITALLPQNDFKRSGNGTQLCKVTVQIDRRTDSEFRSASVNLIMKFIDENDTWYIERESTSLFVGEPDGLDFTIVTDVDLVGQVYYTSDNMVGANYSGIMKYIGREIPTGV